MRLATSTNFFGPTIEGGFTSYIESVRRCHAAGFKVIDINFCGSMKGGGDLAKDNWQQLAHELRNEAEKLGIVFTQAHPVFTKDIKLESEEFQAVYYEMTKRAITVSSILGVKWAVLHPVEVIDAPEFDVEANIKKNREYFDPIVDMAVKHNVGVAFENMIEKVPHRRFSSNASDLKALVEAYDSPLVGACWDFGHSNFIHKDQPAELRTLGKHLKALHVDDNRGSADEHMFPFHGSIDWYSIMPTLTEIGYEGDFTYEAHGEFAKLPDNIKDSIARVGYEIGLYLLSLA